MIFRGLWMLLMMMVHILKRYTELWKSLTSEFLYVLQNNPYESCHQLAHVFQIYEINVTWRRCLDEDSEITKVTTSQGMLRHLVFTSFSSDVAVVLLYISHQVSHFDALMGLRKGLLSIKWFFLQTTQYLPSRLFTGRSPFRKTPMVLCTILSSSERPDNSSVEVWVSSLRGS